MAAVLCSEFDEPEMESKSLFALEAGCFSDNEMLSAVRIEFNESVVLIECKPTDFVITDDWGNFVA
ncbi:hypothetical protein [Endozoicomonas sp. SCSIO W0465]|uniref:hypothetical protein n=1 Tax=Endozoicomonas sp. SCSIO W0465 TaxID=2918516 RepID=UPI002076245E|nr:hypothetical protein [Endozoicomonas sp. SCSIO W0465]USE38976.1 hypothetical protein MJO57_12905 [Endozoicomonas sp. SCSIO W0465]